MHLISILLAFIILASCSNDGVHQGDFDGGVDQRADTALTDDASKECDFGVAAWTGGPTQGKEDALFEFESVDQKISVQFVRSFMKWGSGESAVFSNAGFAIRSDGNTPVCVTDEASLEYTNSLHNWADQAVAKDGQTTYLLDMVYGGTMPEPEHKWFFTISAVENEQTIWGPIDLIKLSGPE